MNEIITYIMENNLQLVPVLYILGIIIKETKLIPDNFIPLILVGAGIVFSLLLNGINTVSLIQGILVAGVTVLGSQTFIQIEKYKRDQLEK